MSNYRRYFVPGGTYFFTITTYRRKPLFAVERNVQLLRQSVAMIKNEQPFVINAAVVRPDHLHFLWSLPPGDDQYSKRIGRIKVKFTRHQGAANICLVMLQSLEENIARETYGNDGFGSTRFAMKPISNGTLITFTTIQ